ncbi:hypothetical protein [Pseudomonas sp. PDM09]|uniref:Cap15 family cyclic dinucleotide receptor domain-containing protein n=1 Tax=Pseudomonas sp. PDM09 TaxID=2769270 RepID=UPI001780DE7C|nr:hypothetical protein [Pseudomonas sp. PDM09]MBD9563981.1 hypothetical protein [Pseudomonas sp. PDM09]
MPQDHEYSVLGGPNRAKIGHTLSIVAAGASSLIITLFLAAVDIAKTLGWAHNIPNLILWPLSAGVIYAAIYWLFEKYVWKLSIISKLLRVPNLSGKWKCEGQSINPDKSLSDTWTGEITIIQSWDRLRIRLKTKQSGSNSIAAALVNDDADGFRLLYNYKNDPYQKEKNLVSHRGCAELLFDHNLKTAEGEYFNGHGRYTFGTMTLERIK